MEKISTMPRERTNEDVWELIDELELLTNRLRRALETAASNGWINEGEDDGPKRPTD